MVYGDTIKRQTRVACGLLVVGQSVAAGLAYSLYAAVCGMNSAAAVAAFGLWRYYKRYVFAFAWIIFECWLILWQTSYTEGAGYALRLYCLSWSALIVRRCYKGKRYYTDREHGPR